MQKSILLCDVCRPTPKQQSLAVGSLLATPLGATGAAPQVQIDLCRKHWGMFVPEGLTASTENGQVHKASKISKITKRHKAKITPMKKVAAARKPKRTLPLSDRACAYCGTTQYKYKMHLARHEQGHKLRGERKLAKKKAA